nr:MAG: DNA pilot protein [Microvirus sp.]
MPLGLGGLAAVVGGTGVLQGIGNLFGQSSANRTNIKLAKQQREWDLKMWNMQNEYNKPENQMSRLNAAGLNPNLVYGSGNVSGNVVGSSPRASVPHVENVMSGFRPNDYAMSALSAYQSMNRNQAEVDLINANRELAERKANSETVNSLLKTVLVDLNRERIPLIRSQKGLTDINIDFTGKKMSLTDSIRAVNEARLPILKNEGVISGVRAGYAERITKQELENLILLSRLRRGQESINNAKIQGMGLDNAIKALNLQIDSDLSKFNATRKDPALTRALLSLPRNLRSLFGGGSNSTPIFNPKVRGGGASW